MLAEVHDPYGQECSCRSRAALGIGAVLYRCDDAACAGACCAVVPCLCTPAVAWFALTTGLAHVCLCCTCFTGAGQLQDLHSKLVLDHPRGEANQLHKCIASASNARGVFDGNVKVRGS